MATEVTSHMGEYVMTQVDTVVFELVMNDNWNFIKGWQVR